MPLFSLTDVVALAATQYQGDKSAAIKALIRSGPNVKYNANRSYADAKLIIARWVARWRVGYPLAWPYMPSRLVRRPPPRWCETLARL